MSSQPPNVPSSSSLNRSYDWKSTHPYPFDPSYVHTLEDLLTVPTPPIPEDYEGFWRNAYEQIASLKTNPRVSSPRAIKQGWQVQDVHFRSTDGVQIGGWLLTPLIGPIERGFVVGHGYGGREGPDIHLSFKNAALFFPCCRGISRSPHPPISSDPQWHVLHNIQDRDRYILRGCVEDTWLAVTALAEIVPDASDRIGYLGISFGGGVGAMACAWDERIRRAHFNIPSFGNQLLRLTFPTVGSGASVQRLHRKEPRIVEKTLGYYDAAAAARFMQQPAHLACALFDPAVAPPGQFAIHNSIPGEKELFVLEAGHYPHPTETIEHTRLTADLTRFFAKL